MFACCDESVEFRKHFTGCIKKGNVCFRRIHKVEFIGCSGGGNVGEGRTGLNNKAESLEDLVKRLDMKERDSKVFDERQCLRWRG
jgi:hypothetical protein